MREVALGNETATSNFGHSCTRVPECLHIGAYLHAFLIAAVCGAAAKPLQLSVFAVGQRGSTP